MGQPSVSLSVPADARFVRIVRMVANGTAATAGLSIGRIEDLILAIDEAAGELLRGEHGTAITSILSADSDGVRVRLATEAAGGQWPRPEWDGSLAATVLESVASEVTFDRDDTTHSVELVVR